MKKENNQKYKYDSAKQRGGVPSEVWKERTPREEVIEALPQIQEILLGMILMVDKICRKHHIQYFLGGGTLLGAVRHGGFIPWDNDADLMLTRPEYDRLLAVLPQELPAGVFIQNCETDPLNHQPFIKLRLDGTVYSTEFTAKYPDMHNGLFIDILAQDMTGPSKWARKKHLYETMLVRSLVFHKWDKSPVRRGVSDEEDAETDDLDRKDGGLSGENGHGKAKRKKKQKLRWDERICTILKDILPQKWLDRRIMKVLVRYQGKDYGLLYDGMGRNIGRGAFPAKWLREDVRLPFHGYRLPVPEAYDRYLTYLYGDYRTPPPEKERELAHSIPHLYLGKYASYRVVDDPERKMHVTEEK